MATALAPVTSRVVEIDNVYTSNSSTTAETSSLNESLVFSPELLQMYYKRLFPFELLHQWLSYGSTATFSRREFSMTIEPVPGEEIYIRYQSFTSQDELAQAVCKRRPVKIDIGAVFSHPPRDKNSVANIATVERELVFDLDLTDYDSVRACGCSAAKICPVCWGFMKMAVPVLDQGLRQDFGFAHIAWFYSGRRGVHAWVCDPAARELTDAGRSAVAQYLEVSLGSDKNKDVQLPFPLHPMMQRAYEVLEPMFVQQVLTSAGHGLLAKPEQWTTLLEAIPETARPVHDHLLKSWSKSDSTPEQKWEQLKSHLTEFIKAQSKAGSSKAAAKLSPKERAQLETWPARIVFQYSYPRLDINVSKMRNHLLKSPFCVHPKTGRVCVPIQDINSFDPFSVPTLPQLAGELDGYQGDDNKGRDWKKTSLKDYFEPFERDFLVPLCRGIRKEQRDAADAQAAMIGDF